ncbi:MAG: permease-like cell division protein FtsX [Sulfurifustis sp.]
MIGFLRKYARNHRYVFRMTLAQLGRAPLAAAMTIATIGITLALPTGLYIVVDNLQRVSHGWDTGGQISLFLKREAASGAIDRFAERVRGLRGVARVEYVSSDQALTEFKRLSGFGDALNLLDRNPLPPVLIVHPAAAQSPGALHALMRELRASEIVDSAQLDLEWVQRLQALLAVAERVVAVLAVLLAAAVLLTIGNTIRLSVLNRRDEIEIMKLMGATDAFIRRPFLYSGVIYGLLGAAVAWFILALVRLFLAEPLASLAASYGAEVPLDGFSATTAGIVLVTGAFLGWLGSRLAVGRHLSAIAPS